MSEQSPPTAGRFVWHDLMTTDLPASVKFYTELFEWSTEEGDMGAMGKYTLIKAGDATIGGFVPLDKNQEVPPHWVGYCTIDSIEAGVSRVQVSGGKVLVNPTDIPDVGRFAVISDPTGAVLSPFQGSGEPIPERDGPPALGDFCWDELMTDNPQAAAAFYEGIFGWKTTEMDMGGEDKYLVMKRGEVQAAGIMKLPVEVRAPPYWLSYVLVTDVDATTSKSEELGGTTLAPPQNIPGMGRFSIIQDPVGAVIAIFAAAQA